MSAPERIAVACLLLGSQVAPAFAAGPPKLEVTTTCSRAAQLAGRDKKACLEDERGAEKTVAQVWSKFNAGDRAQCLAVVTAGGASSYVELLSCLETKREAKGIRQDDESILVETDQSEPLTSSPRR